MELILKENVQGLGFKNEIVTVKDGYGRNFLIPTGKAVLATASAKKELAETLKQQAHKLEKIKNDAIALAEKINAVEGIKIATKVSATGGAYLGSDLDTLYSVDLFSQCDSVVLDLFELVSLLLERLCKFLFGRSRSEDSLTGGNEEVAAVAVFHGDDFVLETETLHVFFENEFHVYTSSFNYFIKSVT